MDINKRTFIDWSTVPYCPIDDANRSRYAIKRGDVFVIRMADPGKVGFCEDDIEAVFASYLVRLRPASESITPLYLFFTLSDTAYQDWVTGASTGATRKSVSARVMTEPRILLPDRGTQGRFEAAVGPMRQMLGSLVKASSLLAATRDLLLPKLVTGQIDVSCLDLDLGGVCA
jgi:type I restriction enzyme S subunit